MFRIDQLSFRTVGERGLGDFLLFSFNAILHTEFSTMTPASPAALALANLQLVSSLVIGLFFVFVLLTSQRERYRQELAGLVQQLSTSAKEIENFLGRELGMKLIEVEVKITEQDPGFSSTMQSLNRVRLRSITRSY